MNSRFGHFFELVIKVFGGALAAWLGLVLLSGASSLIAGPFGVIALIVIGLGVAGAAVFAKDRLPSLQRTAGISLAIFALCLMFGWLLKIPQSLVTVVFNPVIACVILVGLAIYAWQKK